MFLQSWELRTKITLLAFLFLIALSANALYIRNGQIERRWFLHGLLIIFLLVYILNLLWEHGKKLWREYLLVLSAFSLVFIAAEVVLRFLMPWLSFPPLTILASARLHHRLPSSVKMYDGTFRGKPCIFTTNDDGLRTAYSREEYLNKPTRIALMGDSFVMGVGLPEGACLACRLEFWLRSRTNQDDVAVLNCGVISYSPLLSLQQYATTIHNYSPQTVIFILDASDIGNDRHYGKEWDEVQRAFNTEDSQFARKVPSHLSAVWKLSTPIVEPLLSRPLNEFLWGLGFPNGKNSSPKKEVKEFSTFFIYKEPLRRTKPYLDVYDC